MKTLKLVTHWTPDEAASIYDMLDQVKTAIWEAYGNDITEAYKEMARSQEQQLELFADDLDF